MVETSIAVISKAEAMLTMIMMVVVMEVLMERCDDGNGQAWYGESDEYHDEDDGYREDDEHEQHGGGSTVIMFDCAFILQL